MANDLCVFDHATQRFVLAGKPETGCRCTPDSPFLWRQQYEATKHLWRRQRQYTHALAKDLTSGGQVIAYTRAVPSNTNAKQD